MSIQLRHHISDTSLPAACCAQAGRAGRCAAAGPGPWTAEEIRARLGISTAIHQKVRLGAREIAAIAEAGIRQIELLLLPRTFDFRDSAQRREVLTACRQHEVRIVSAHANLETKLASEDPALRDAAVRDVVESIRFLEDVGGGLVVAHFGASVRGQASAVEALEATSASRVQLTTENMRGGLAPYVAMVDRVASARFGLTVDIGHARGRDGVNPFTREGAARQALAPCKGRMFNVHLHESFAAEQKPDHRPPLHPDGIIRWDEVFAGLRDIDYGGWLLFEDGRGEEPQEWTRMAAAFPDNFIKRYAP